MEELFPLRIVTGERFCNREKERLFLKNCIEQKRPAVLISPRRYGKTSLASKVIDELKYPSCSIDLLTTYDDSSICSAIIKSVSGLISEIMPVNMKTVQLIESCFYGVRAVIRSKLIDLEFSSPAEKTDPVRQVLETLRGLENLSEKLNKTVIVFIDEFQRTMETSKGNAIQGAIRSVAQSAKYTTFLFSGSSRHMLSTAFDDPGLPLYMMCEKLILDRISSVDYIPYIQDAAKIKWRKTLPEDVVQRILDLTENHPFYVNYLCSRVWLDKKLPTLQDVDLAWLDCFLTEERRLIETLDSLALNQRVLLKAIANTSYLEAPTSTSFLSQINMSSGTATPALQSLKKKDMIYTDAHHYTRVLDPLLKFMLVNANPV